MYPKLGSLILVFFAVCKIDDQRRPNWTKFCNSTNSLYLYLSSDANSLSVVFFIKVEFLLNNDRQNLTGVLTGTFNFVMKYVIPVVSRVDGDACPLVMLI